MSHQIAKFKSGRIVNDQWQYLWLNKDRYHVEFMSNGDAKICDNDKADLVCVDLKYRLGTIATHRRVISSGLYSAFVKGELHNEDSDLERDAKAQTMFRGPARSPMFECRELTFEECRTSNVVLYCMEESTVTIDSVIHSLDKGYFVFLSALDFRVVVCQGKFKVYM